MKRTGSNGTFSTPKRQLGKWFLLQPSIVFNQKSKYLALWKQDGTTMFQSNHGTHKISSINLTDRRSGETSLFIFDTPETAQQVLPLLPRADRIIIELEIDNQVHKMSAIATRELERLHKIPAGECPSIENWRQWYGCRNMTQMFPMFTQTNGPRTLVNSIQRIGRLSYESALGQKVWIETLINKEHERAGKTWQHDGTEYPDGIIRHLTNPAAQMHSIEGRPTKNRSTLNYAPPVPKPNPFTVKKITGRTTPLDLLTG